MLLRKATKKDYDLFHVHNFFEVFSSVIKLLSGLLLLGGLISKFMFSYKYGEDLIYSGIAFFLLGFLLLSLRIVTSYQTIVIYQGVKFLGLDIVEEYDDVGTLDPILKNSDGMYARVSFLLEAILFSKEKDEIKKHLNLEKLEHSNATGDFFDIENTKKLFNKNKVQLFHDFYELDEVVYKMPPKANKFGNLNKLTLKYFIQMLKDDPTGNKRFF